MLSYSCTIEVYRGLPQAKNPLKWEEYNVKLFLKPFFVPNIKRLGWDRYQLNYAAYFQWHFATLQFHTAVE